VFPPEIRYKRATSLEEALMLVDVSEPRTKIVAGGTLLIPLLKARAIEVENLVDIGRLEELRFVRNRGSVIEIGALTREAQIGASRLLRRTLPILVDASSSIADPAIRNMGTFGGAISTGSAVNDHAATALALGAQLVVRARERSAIFDVDTFYIAGSRTRLGDTGILVSVRLPVPAPNEGSAYVRLRELRGKFPAAAVWVSVVNGSIRSARIALTNAASKPARFQPIEKALIGLAAEDQVVETAAELAREVIDPTAELRGSVEYKRQIATVVLRRALRLAIRRATRLPHE
jgi:carbon-monoxide dehydrogenase medium subunit